jgi:hypothetical protein
MIHKLKKDILEIISIRSFLKVFNRLRREFMKLIDKDFLDKKLRKRKGFCNKCGDCCKGCKYLKDKKCIVYNNRPWFCYKEFPLDRLDQKIWGVKNCSYWFE